MTIRERARQFVLDYNVRDIFRAQEAPTEELVGIIEQALAAEREAIARMADNWTGSQDALAAAIRARGKEAGDANPPQ